MVLKVWTVDCLLLQHKLNNHLKLHKILEREGFKSLFIGVDPLNEPDDIELISHMKYQLMDKNTDLKDIIIETLDFNKAHDIISIDLTSHIHQSTS